MSKEKEVTENKIKEADVSNKEEHATSPKELQEFLEAGVHFGHQKSSVNPKMFPYIYCVRSNTHLLDVTKTKKKLEKALEFVEETAKQGKTILFVGTRLPVRDIIKEAAEEVNMPYVISRWAGGTLTNWTSIKERVDHLKELRELKSNKEEWEKYPKNERLMMEREIKKLEDRFGGIEKMDKLPDAVFLVDLQEDEIAAIEAKKIGIPTVGIVDTNINPGLVDYIIPANDDAITSVKFITEKVKNAMKGGNK